MGVTLGISSLYRNSHSLKPIQLTHVKIEDNEILFSQAEQAFRRLYARSQAAKDIQDGQQLLEKGVDNRLLGAIDLLSLASASGDARVRLINLWSSIETLAGAHEGNTTLERVLNLVVPLVMSRLVSRRVRTLAISTQKLGVVLNDFEFGNGFRNSHAGFVSPRDVLKTLAAPAHSKPICEYLRFAEHPLLRFRVFQEWQMFSDPKRLRQSLSRTKQRLEWQIARIYRARNLLVHQGEESPFLVPLVDNLQNYLSMTLQRAIHELKVHPKWTLRNVIEYWNGNMNYIFNCLQTCPQQLTVDDFIDGDKKTGIWTIS